jgi:hypothetical protein
VVDSVAFLQTPVIPPQLNYQCECSLAVCAADAGTAGRATMYATLALASINSAAT